MQRKGLMVLIGWFLLVGVLHALPVRKLARINLAGQPEEAIKNLLSYYPDIASYNPKDQTLVIVTDEDELLRIGQLGFPFDVIIADIDAYARVLRQQDYLDHFHSYEQTLAEMQAVEAAYPEIARLYDIGDSWEKTQGLADRDIWAIKISDNVDLEEIEEPEVLYLALHHAREIITPEILLYFMHYLVDRYGTDPEVTYLVNNHQLWLVPIVNPDGYAYVFTGSDPGNPNDPLWWRKNKRDNNGNGQFDPDWDGVDLNRNYGFQWGYDNLGSSPNPGAQTYRGTGPFSEPETQAIRDLVEAHNFVISLSYHSYGEMFLYPWGYIYEDTPDHPTFLAIADSCVAYNGYEHGNSASGLIYLTNGDTDDWMYGEQTTKYKVFGFTPEVGSINDGVIPGDGFHPDTSMIMPQILDNMGPNLYVAYAAEQYSPRPEIIHTPLTDTEDEVGPYLIVATVTSPVFHLDTSSLWVYFNIAGTSPFDSLSLLPTGSPDEYAASIPSQGPGVTIYYYLCAWDSIPRAGYAPPGAPEELFSFHVGADIIPPTISHTPLGDQSIHFAPYLVRAVIIDNIGIFTATIYFRRNGGTVDSSVMVPTAAPDVYEGFIDPDPLVVGDLIEYCMVAIDAAASANTASAPITGYYSFTILGGLAFDFEADDGGFFPNWGGDWEWGTPTSGPFGAHSGDRVWATGLGNYSDLSDSRLDMPPIDLSNMLNPVLTFWHWYLIEYSDGIYWDGGNLKISVDEGPFELITPVGGYDGIVDNYNTVIGGEPAYGGPASTGNFWHQETVDLSPWVNHTVVVRFHFGSDAYVNAPGWYFDDVEVLMGVSAVPLFTNTTHLPNTANTEGPYWVSSYITDDTGIAQASLFYSTDGGAIFFYVPMDSLGDHLYQGGIPGQPYGTTVNYYLWAMDDSANVSTDPPGAPDFVFSFIVSDQMAAISIEPISLSLIAVQGEMAVDTLYISNLGLLDLHFSIRDSSVGGFSRTETLFNVEERVFPDLSCLKGIDIDALLRKFPTGASGHNPASTQQVELILTDPVGDILYDPSVTKPDIVAIYAGVEDGSVTFQFEFNEDVVEDSTFCILSIDADQDVNTGVYPPGLGAGLPSQDVGSEYELVWDVPNLSGLGSSVIILDGSGQSFLGFAPITVDSTRISATIPLYILGNDDGNFNVCAMAVAGQYAAGIDYAPDVGHGTVGTEVEATWLSEFPDQGTVPGLGSVPIEIMANGAFLTDGLYEAVIIISSNDPNQPETHISVQFAVGEVGIDTPERQLAIPEVLALGQNYPNPFNANTEIRYQIPNARFISLKIYNILGQEVRILVNENKEPGYYVAIWDGDDRFGRAVASGVYFYRMETGDFVKIKKMILLR